MSQVKAINEALLKCMADLTILLDVEPEVGLRRHRQAASEAEGPPAQVDQWVGQDRAADLKFHQGFEMDIMY